MKARAWFAPVVVLWVVLLGAGCSATSAPMVPPDAANSGSTEATPTSAAAPPVAETPSVAATLGPIDTALAPVNGTILSPADQMAEALDQARWVEDKTAQCMKDQGFDYTPALPTIQTGLIEDYRPDDRDWISSHGYGVTNTNSPPTTVVDTSDSGPDPNAAYVASLSPAEKDAYSNTLSYSNPSPFYPDLPPLPESKIGNYGNGCHGWAEYQWVVEHPSFAPWSQGSQFQPLYDAIDTFYADLGMTTEGTPEPFETAWAQCMAAAGRPGYTRQREARDQFMADYNAVATSTGLYPAEEADWSQKEIALALDDLNCRESTNYTAQQQASQRAAEEQFVTDHRSEFAALKLAAEQAQASHH